MSERRHNIYRGIPREPAGDVRAVIADRFCGFMANNTRRKSRVIDLQKDESPETGIYTYINIYRYLYRSWNIIIRVFIFIYECVYKSNTRKSGRVKRRYGNNITYSPAPRASRGGVFS